ncbi:MAG: AmmeMemoRadiSam system protein B [Caldithrix sp.]|nr:AmmeMemoRadiSam system protein B [Caldithrix sp.]
MNNKNIRQAAVAGMFYSGDKNTLEREVAVFLENSREEQTGQRLFGIVAPHAGYMFSGGVAARSYRQLVGKAFDTVVVVSPSHRTYFEEISIYDGDAYNTPLGSIETDHQMADELTNQNERIIRSDLGHAVDEHALEVQLPFLQHVLEDFKLVPVVMGNQDGENVHILADALARVVKDKNALLVASSDLSHFHSYDQAVTLDKVVVDQINRFNYQGLLEDLQTGVCEMCGGGPVAAVMKACEILGADHSRVLLYRNSGDVTGDKSKVVGYLSAVFYQ